MAINADSLNQAIKNYVKIHRNMKINKMIIKDKHKHFKAKMKYFRKSNVDKVGINIYPLPNGLVPVLSSNGPVGAISPLMPFLPHMRLPASPVIHAPISPVWPFGPRISIIDHAS